MRWIPSLTHEEIAVVEQYYQHHRAELDEEDRRIREYTEERIREQKARLSEPEETAEELFARLKKLLRERQEKNGERNSSGHQH